MKLIQRVGDHLLKQNAKSENAGGYCLYRGPKGTSCAIGCLIKDEHYTPYLEKKGTSDMRVREALERSVGRALTEKEKNLLGKLQSVHDSYPIKDWRKLLIELGYKP